MVLDAEDIERIAQRVVELLRADTPVPEETAPVRLVDAATVARTLGVTREWVYLHSRELRAVRLGGPKGRLRFDLQAIAANGRSPEQPAAPEPARQGPWLSRGHHLESQVGRRIKRPGSVGAPPARHREV